MTTRKTKSLDKKVNRDMPLDKINAKYRSLDSLFNQSGKIYLDYERKDILFTLDAYGNHLSDKINMDMSDIESHIDDQFTRAMIIGKKHLEGILSSSTHGKNIADSLIEAIKLYDLYLVEHGGKKGITFSHFEKIEENYFQSFFDAKKDKEKIDDYFNTLLTEKREKKVRLIDIKNLEKLKEKRKINITEIIKNNYCTKILDKHFDIVDNTYSHVHYGTRNENGEIVLSQVQGKPTIDTIVYLESKNFKFANDCKEYKRLMTTKIFSELGE